MNNKLFLGISASYKLLLNEPFFLECFVDVSLIYAIIRSQAYVGRSESIRHETSKHVQIYTGRAIDRSIITSLRSGL